MLQGMIFLREEILQQNRRAKPLQRALTRAQKTTWSRPGRVAVGVSGANAAAAAAPRRRITGAKAPVKGRKGPATHGADAGRRGAGFRGRPRAGGRREGTGEGAGLGHSGPTAPQPRLPLTASPQTPLCSCPRPGGAPAGGAEFPHWLSRRLPRLASEPSGVGRVFSLLLVVWAARQTAARGDCPAAQSPWKQFRETPRAAGIASRSVTGGGRGWCARHF